MHKTHVVDEPILKFEPTQTSIPKEVMYYIEMFEDEDVTRDITKEE